LLPRITCYQNPPSRAYKNDNYCGILPGYKNKNISGYGFGMLESKWTIILLTKSHESQYYSLFFPLYYIYWYNFVNPPPHSRKPTNRSILFIKTQ
jgi:hypothetical protein